MKKGYLFILGISLFFTPAFAQNDELFYAAKFSGATEINAALAKGAQINALNDNDDTPLMIAAFKGSAIAVKTLLEKGADHTIKNNDETAFDLAVKRNDKEVIQAFIYGKPTKEMVEIIFCNATTIEIFKKATTMGANMNTTKCDGDPLIFAVVGDGNVQLSAELFKMGVNANGKDTEGSPLIFYTEKNEMIKLLIDNKVDVYAINANGKTIMQYYIESYLTDGVQTPKENMKFLVDNGYVILTKAIPNKSVLKFIDEFMPADSKKTPAATASFTEKSKLKKEELKTYLISKGAK